MRLPKLLTGSDQSYVERVLRMIASMLGFQASIWLAYWLLWWFLHVFKYRGFALSFYVWGVFVGCCVAGVMFRAVLARSDKIKAETEAKLAAAEAKLADAQVFLRAAYPMMEMRYQFPILYGVLRDDSKLTGGLAKDITS